MKGEKTACTSGGKCPLRNYCEHYKNHEMKNTKTYFMAEFDDETKKCRNFKYLEKESDCKVAEKRIFIKLNGKKTII